MPVVGNAVRGGEGSISSTTAAAAATAAAARTDNNDKNDKNNSGTRDVQQALPPRQRTDSTVSRTSSCGKMGLIGDSAKTPLPVLPIERMPSTDSADSLGWSSVPTPRLDTFGDIDGLRSIAMGETYTAGGEGCGANGEVEERCDTRDSRKQDGDNNDEENVLLRQEFNLDGSTPFSAVASSTTMESSVIAQPEDIEELRLINLDTPKVTSSSSAKTDELVSSGQDLTLPPGSVRKCLHEDNKMVSDLAT